MEGKAAIFTGPGRPFEIARVPIPEVEPGAVLVRVRLANICGSDLHWWRGEAWLPPKPAVLGHEMCGEVVELGAGVTTDSTGAKLGIGDRVIYPYFFSCGRCYACLSGNLAACVNKFRQRRGRMKEEPIYWFGAYAEYFYLRPGHYVFKLPDELSDEMSSPINCAVSQAMYSMQQVQIRYGDTVAIQGAGGLGVNAAAVARELGAGQVIVIDKVPARLELARAFGADEVVDMSVYPTPESRVERVKALTDGRGADVVAEFVGHPAAIAEGVSMLRDGGSYLLVGNINDNLTLQMDPAKIVVGNKRLVGVATYEPRAIAQAIQLMQRTRDRYPFEQVLSHKFPLERINEAFAVANRGAGTRVALVP